MAAEDEEDEIIKELIRQRDEFLQKHPHLKPVQKEIDRELDEAGEDPAKRMEAIGKMIVDLIDEELVPEMEKLKEIGNDIDIEKFKKKRGA